MKLAVALVAVAVAIALGATAGQASTPRPIVFSADRAPIITGEIYRVGRNGRRTDLSRSPYDDEGPVVSSDGKHVAFVRYRGSLAGVFEVGIDGRGLVPAEPMGLWYPQGLAWQPAGTLMAVETGPGVSIIEPGHRPITLHGTTFALGDDDPELPSPWSLDGRVLLLWQGQHELRAVSPSGQTLWTHRGKYSEAGFLGGGWSSAGLVAVTVGRGVVVYDESGRLRFRYLLPWTPSGLVWSPDGSHLAASWETDSAYKLQVRTASGGVLLQRGVPGDAIGWASTSTVVIASERSGGAVGVDSFTGRLGSLSQRWLDPLSADKTLALVTRGNVLGAAPTAGGPFTTYRNLGGCDEEYETQYWAAFAGHAIVYASTCTLVQTLFSTGGRIHRLTRERVDETQPALSPDGTQIAYVRPGVSRSAGLRASKHFDGFPCFQLSGIRIVDAVTGAPIRTLTHPPVCTFDNSPSWSPDGQTIVYSEKSRTTKRPGELFTIPAAGGTPSDISLVGGEPAWGPAEIAYVGSVRGGIWTADPDGGNATEVSSKGSHPAWSRTGTLAYLVGRSTVMVGQTAVHLPFVSVRSLAWSPDGRRFVVVANKTEDGLQDVFTVKTDGTDPVRLTTYYDASSASTG